MRRALLLGGLCVSLAACGAGTSVKRSSPPAKQRRAGGIPGKLRSEVRPIGHGPRFQPPVRGTIGGSCSAPLGRRLQAHVELFGANRVVLLATGIGTRPPRTIRDGRMLAARCFGDVVTLDPTGTVYFRPGRRLTIGDLFSAWGQPLSRMRLASFAGGTVRVFIDGHRVSVPPRAVRLTDDAEIVLEVGPRVPPHSRFSFPQSPSPRMR